MINQIQHLNGQMEDRKTYLSCELSEIIHHIRTHGLISDAELGELRAKAREKADGRNKADREKIDQLYGSYQNEFSNRTKADPTAKAALSGRS